MKARIGELSKRANPHIARVKRLRRMQEPCKEHRVLVSYSKGRKKEYCTRCGHQSEVET